MTGFSIPADIDFDIIQSFSLCELIFNGPLSYTAVVSAVSAEAVAEAGMCRVNVL